MATDLDFSKIFTLEDINFKIIWPSGLSTNILEKHLCDFVYIVEYFENFVYQ